MHENEDKFRAQKPEVAELKLNSEKNNNTVQDEQSLTRPTSFTILLKICVDNSI